MDKVEEFKKRNKEWNRVFKETGVPICMTCSKPMKPAYDSITKKLSEYSWRFDCKCKGTKNIVLCMV